MMRGPTTLRFLSALLPLLCVAQLATANDGKSLLIHFPHPPLLSLCPSNFASSTNCTTLCLLQDGFIKATSMPCRVSVPTGAVLKGRLGLLVERDV